MAQQDPDSSKGSGGWARQAALAMDLPFVLVGAVLVGGILGYFLDRWLHTKPYLMLVLGAVGFSVGVRDVLRRLSKN
ncbi:MAG TPA: AtpZ/AtpI family protein [Candidatus Sulfotelmatobacter sp.]|nr:AtpZ/AtpI family protein [Candidatus Sulfotelmatobacter sp.]